MPAILHQVHRLHTAGDVLCAVDCVRALPEYRHAFFVHDDDRSDTAMATTLADLHTPVNYGATIQPCHLTSDLVALIYHCIGYDEQWPGQYVSFWQEPPGVTGCAWIHTPGRCGWIDERYTFLNHRGVSRLAFNSTFTRDNTPGLDLSRFRDTAIIHPTIDVGRYAPITRTDGVFRIGRWNRADDRKYSDDFLDLMASIDIPGVTFECMGIPPKFRGRPAPANVRWIENHAMPVEELLSRITVLLFKTDAAVWHEGWCRTVTEAMAAGVVPVVENRGGITDQVRHGYNGFLCDDNRDFKRFCELLYRDHDLRAAMSANARAYARRRLTLGRLRADLSRLLGLPPAGLPRVARQA
ncbi:MAG: glycosyltransferase [Dehalococcoidia bacterium]